MICNRHSSSTLNYNKVFDINDLIVGLHVNYCEFASIIIPSVDNNQIIRSFDVPNCAKDEVKGVDCR